MRRRTGSRGGTDRSGRPWAPAWSWPEPTAAVEALAAFDDGGGTDLYAAGTFTAAGTQPVNRIARYDGSSWLPVDNGVDSEVRALEVFDDGGGPALYAGGTFLHAGGMPASFIARWDGASWSAVGAGLSNWVYALAVFDDGTGKALYAAGRSIGVRRWKDSTWTQVGGLSVVYALHVWDDGAAPHLYAGGIFSAVGGNNVARLDGGTWTSLGSGTDALVTAFAHLDDAAGPGLFATGYFTIAGGVSADRVARWNGTAWSALGDTFTGTDWNAIAAFDAGSSGGPDVYVGGEFTRIGARWSSNVARWVPCAAPGSPFCFGDGSGAACPCVNFGLRSGWVRKLESSTGGARLRAIGSVAADTVVLEVTGERPPCSRSSCKDPSIAPHLFGDGLRCTGGTLKRMYSKSAVGGAVFGAGPGRSSRSARARRPSGIRSPRCPAHLPDLLPGRSPASVPAARGPVERHERRAGPLVAPRSSRAHSPTIALKRGSSRTDSRSGSCLAHSRCFSRAPGDIGFSSEVALQAVDREVLLAEQRPGARDVVEVPRRGRDLAQDRAGPRRRARRARGSRRGGCA
jgi:hypothetical protein